MECWICAHGRRTGAGRVGVCWNCNVSACDEHGDRQTKDRFWCYVCLQRIALDTSGLPIVAEEAMGGEATLSDEQLDSLMSRLAREREESADILNDFTAVVLSSVALFPAAGSPLAEHALEAALALAIRCAGSDPLRDPSELESVADVVDIYLFNLLMRRGL